VERLSIKEILILALGSAAIFGSTFLALKATVVSTGQMAIWPADAITLSMMLAMKRRPLLALVVCRSAAAALSIATAFPPFPAISVNVASVIGVMTVYMLVQSKITPSNISNVRLLGLLFSTSALGAIVSAVIQAESLSFYFHIKTLPILESCFAANLLGFVVIVPITLIMAGQRWRAPQAGGAASAKRLAFVANGAGVIAIFNLAQLPLLFMIPIGLVVLAYVTDVGTVAASILLTTLVAITASVSGHGPFTLLHVSPPGQLLVLQFFLGIITLFSLPTAALMSEHKRLKAGLIAAKSEAEAANEAKSQFLAMISHEIRTPLNGVLGMTQIMAMNTLDGAQAERLQIIQRSGETLLSILNDVLDLSKIEAGKLTLEAIAFDLGELLETVADVYAPLAREKGLRLRRDLCGANGIYRGDPTRLRQILTNLLSNALKFTEHGDIGITAAYADTTLRLCVSDTGIGIPTEKLDRLFAKFTQADETTTRRFGGTGLGLSICRELTAMMGGSIAVQSQVGSGSSFTAIIPLSRVGEVASACADGEVKDLTFGKGVRVLAAEDNPTNQLVLRTLLEMAGCEVVIVGNGAEAVAEWERDDWDLILMDIQMPIMDGADATRAIRAKELASGRPRTPIIALTANTMAHQVDGYRMVGIDGHVSKPINAEALFTTIAAFTADQDKGAAFAA